MSEVKNNWIFLQCSKQCSVTSLILYLEEFKRNFGDMKLCVDISAELPKTIEQLDNEIKNAELSISSFIRAKEKLIEKIKAAKVIQEQNDFSQKELNEKLDKLNKILYQFEEINE